MRSERRVPLGRHFWGALLRLLIWLFLSVKVRGAERVPPDGAGIIYYNHIHWLDPVLICGKLKRYAVPLTKIEASRWPLVGWLLRRYHVIFITRGVVDRAALRDTWQVLANGDISVISPEGTRSRDGALQYAREGLAFVARQAPDAWLIPCAVVGTPQFRWGLPLLGRPKVELIYGRPFRLLWPRNPDGTLEQTDGRSGRDTLRRMTDEAMAELAMTLPPGMRGDYAGVDVSESRWLQFME